MRGRKPLPIATRRLRGMPIMPHVPEPANAIPAPPADLDGEALVEWNRITPQLLAAGLLTQLDLAAVLAYCQVFGRWRDAEQHVKRQGSIVKSPSGYPMMNPHLSVANKALNQLRQLAGELGLSPSSRTRISTPPARDAEQDAFAEWKARKSPAIGYHDGENPEEGNDL